MGSEHYCLRWNNHQSNLLGVFSQLLQDESLVDVTLACSEGASIRAHKVVLSACSSYFQTLFLDHPSRHPIVILKDVRFSELRTLVEFMYKGEVNVQYCQLSALLKTAESLKVKGLAEMTNQSTALREPEREPDCLRPPSLSSASRPPSDSLEATTTATTPKRLETDRCTPSPTRLQLSPTPLALYHRKINRDYSEPPETINNEHTGSNNDDRRSQSPDEDDAMSNDVGINMTIHSNSTNSIPPPALPTSSVLTNPVNSTVSVTPEIRPASRGTNAGGITTVTSCATILAPSSSGLSSPSISSEPVAGPSGLGPVQSVPLSLKKEIDWDRSDDKSIGECSSDYTRHHNDPEATDPHGIGPPLDQGGPIFPCMYCGASFPHQSKLTRHILSHSLETLKYRESTHYLHLSNFPHDIPPPQHFGQRTVPPIDSLEPPDGSPMDIEFAAAAAAAAAASNSISTNSSDQGSVVLCKFCGKSFPDVSSLITHLPVHTGDRPFKCEFCGKAFKLRHHMKDHCRVHTGERPFRCGMCGKTFSRSTILKAHEKTHYPKYVRKFLSPSPVETKDEPPN